VPQSYLSLVIAVLLIIPYHSIAGGLVKTQRSREFLEWARSLTKPALVPLIVFVIHVIAHAFLRVYQIYPLFDIPMHICGGLAIAYFLDTAYVNSSAMSGIPANWLIRTLLVFTSTCTVAVFWEFAEFILAWMASKDFQPGLADTMKDLFFGIMGSVFYIVGVSLFNEKRSRVLNREQMLGGS
jgi:hypothetical protein